MNCIFIYFFRKWIGPLGIFLSSTLTIVLTLILTTYTLFLVNNFGFYIYFDFGRWFFILDILDSHLLFFFDNLSLTVTALVLFLSIFAQYFGSEYMYREAYINRLLYLLNMFITSVIFLFIVFDFFLILIVWELIGLFSLLLVNFYSVRIYTLKAALKTFILSRLSDTFIFFAFLFFIIFFSSTDFSIIFFKIPFYIFYNIYILSFGFNLLNFIAILIVLSGSVKAAQFLFHTWLPDAMEAPTPASALIHSSTLVIMGIYFIIRFNIIFEFTLLANYLLTIIGGMTIAFGAISATFQNDIKKLVAYSTISQMGYLFCGCGFLCYNEVIFYLAMHALNKAFLFIIVGYIVHFFSGNTDLRFMGSLYFYTIDVFFILIFISLNLTGLPITSGFIAKEFLLFQTFRDDFFIFFIRSCWFISFLFTPIYMLLINLIVFFNTKNSFVSLYINIFNSTYKSFFIYFNKYSNTFLTTNSLFFSKLTVLFLFLFFFITNYFGEFFFLINLNIISLNYFTLSSTLNLHYINYFFNNEFFTITSLSSISNIVAIFFFFALRYLCLII